MKLQARWQLPTSRHLRQGKTLAEEHVRPVDAQMLYDWCTGTQIEIMEEKVRAAKQEAASQVAAARKEAAAAQEDARREAQRHCASTMASAIEREAALSANLADLRAEYEVCTTYTFSLNRQTFLNTSVYRSSKAARTQGRPSSAMSLNPQLSIHAVLALIF